MDETFLSVILASSVAGAGLLLAVCALMTPIIAKIFQERVQQIALKKTEFDQAYSSMLNGFNKESPEESFKKINKLEGIHNQMKTLGKFPKYLREVVIISFMMFILATVVCFFELMNFDPEVGFSLLGSLFAPILFFLGLFFFFTAGYYAFWDVADWMSKQFDNAKNDGLKIEKSLEQAKANLSSSITNKKRQTDDE